MKLSELTNNELNQKSDQFMKLVDEGVRAWQAAGDMLVQLVDRDPLVYDYLIKRNPRLDAGVLGNLERVGRKEISPLMLLHGGAGIKALSQLPLSQQEHYAQHRLPLVVEKDGGVDVLMVFARDLTVRQAAQVFTDKKLRTEGEQRAWLFERRADEARRVSIASELKPAYTIIGRKVRFNGPVTLTKRELTLILQQLK